MDNRQIRMRQRPPARPSSNSTLYFVGIPVLFAAALLGYFVFGTKSRPAPNSDQTKSGGPAEFENEPKSVVLFFAKSVQSGDKKALRSVCEGSDEQFKMIDAMSDINAASQKLKAACDTRFGVDNHYSKDLAGDMLGNIKKCEFILDGDSATMVSKEHPNEPNPFKLKKTNGVWKINLKLFADGYAQTAQIAPVIIRASTECAQEVAAGKYKSAEEMVQTLTDKVNANVK